MSSKLVRNAKKLSWNEKLLFQSLTLCLSFAYATLNLINDSYKIVQCVEFKHKTPHMYRQTDKHLKISPHNPHCPHRKSPQKEMQKEFLQVSGGSSCDKRRKSFVC
jgi:hypothetical protein